DLVLMDLAMPGMSGLEATRQIKARPSGPRVIILTLYDSPEYRAAAQELGADGFVIKSEFFDQLQPAIHTLFAQIPASAGQGPASAGQGPASAGQGPASAGQVSTKGPKELRMQNILVVDDSPTMRRMVIASLDELQGVSFDQAGSGLEAIERLALAPVNLMILDLNMPDLNGLEVIKFTRQHNAYRALPIIVLTTRGDEASRAATLAAGATLYLTKPFGPADLTRHARELLGA
ncbi:MAG: response regulator transcription factor, partial [Delftia sp.]|nr:response regulator transcription factor [Delftia sp.]